MVRILTLLPYCEHLKAQLVSWLCRSFGGSIAGDVKRLVCFLVRLDETLRLPSESTIGIVSTFSAMSPGSAFAVSTVGLRDMSE